MSQTVEEAFFSSNASPQFPSESKKFCFKEFAAFPGKPVLPHGTAHVVFKGTVQTVSGIPDTVGHIGDCRKMLWSPRLKINQSDLHITRPRSHAEKSAFRSCQDLLIMLGDNVPDTAQMG